MLIMRGRHRQGAQAVEEIKKEASLSSYPLPNQSTRRCSSEQMWYPPNGGVETVKSHGHLVRVGLNLLEARLELRPVLHDDLGAEIEQFLGHFGTLLIAMIAADVGNHRNACTNGTEGTAAAVLDGNALLGLLAQAVQSVQVDGRVGLGCRSGQRGGGTKDMVGFEVLFLTGFLDRGTNAAKSRRGYHGQVVFTLTMQRLQLLVDADARFTLGLELGNHLVLFLLDVVLELFLGHLEAVFGLERNHHAAKVLADEILDQLFASVAICDVMLGEDLVGDVGAGLKGQLLGHHEGVVAVEQQLSNLRVIDDERKVLRAPWPRGIKRSKHTFGMVAAI